MLFFVPKIFYGIADSDSRTLDSLFPILNTLKPLHIIELVYKSFKLPKEKISGQLNL